jgi:predicted nuclease of predicted toxin-antitoxin system
LDEHIPNAVAQALRARGIDALTASEAGLLSAPDTDYLIQSQASRRVVVTHDPDFFHLHRRQSHAGIAFCEQGTRTIGQMVASLTLIYEVLEPSDMVGRIEFL